VSLRHARDAGSILIVSLWTLFFLAALALAVSTHVSASVHLAGQIKKDTLGRLLAEAGAQKATMEILSQTNTVGLGPGTWNNDPDAFSGELATEDGRLGAYEVTYVIEAGEGGWVTNIGVLCEEAKVNLNQLSNVANRDLFKMLVVRAGGRPEDAAAQIVSAVVDWCDQDGDAMLRDGEEDGYYQQLSSPYSGHNGDLQSLHELLLVRGVDDDLFLALQPYITVYGKSDRININTASPMVLECVALARGVSARDATEVADKIVQARPKPALHDFEVLQSGPAVNMKVLLTVQASTFRGRAAGMLDADEVVNSRIGFVFDKEEGRLLYWYEQ